MKSRAVCVLILLAALCAKVNARCEATEPDISKPPTYAEYLETHADAARPNQAIVVHARDYLSLGDSGAYVEPEATCGVNGALIWASGTGEITYAFNVEHSGLYEMHITYLALPDRRMDLEFAFELDGRAPYDRANSILLARAYAPEGEIVRDSRQNDVRPRLAETQIWQKTALCDTRSFYDSPYLIYLERGEHTFTLSMIAECMAIDTLEFVNPAPPPPHSEYIKAYSNISGGADAQPIVIQAESAQLCSSQTLYPLPERASAATQPADPVKTRMNTIGGEGWKQQGQWLEWKFNVSESGLYYFSMRALQEYARGMSSMRTLTIDGASPFAEAARFAVKYKVDFTIYTLGGDTPLAIYLEKGEHTMRLAVAGSQLSDSLRKLLDAADEMSAIYRQIIVITGANADADRVTIDLNRDFHLDQKIPNLIERLGALKLTLETEYAAIEAITGSGSEATMLSQMARQLDSFIKKPETIPKRLESFKDNIASLSSWALNIANQPLLMDYIVFTPVGKPLPTGKVGFFEQISFRWRAFVGSFSENYSAVGDIYDSDEAITINVWVCSNDLGATGIASGRDQTRLIKELIDQSFVPETGIQVNLSLIDGSGTLMQATLGGKGPDVAMMVYKELPVNLAMRGALADISQFEGFAAAKERFYPSALTPYEYQGGVYALPETQNFYMIFYRKDMFDELKLEVPNTWKEMKALIPLLNSMAMRVGVPEPTVTNNNTMGFQIHLFQRGLNYYTEDLSRTLFDQPEALDAFVEWTDLYTKYSLPVKYDFFSRFRTGEMPLALDMYTMANTLAAAAPELDGLWDIAPIPGIMREDGVIDRSEGAMGTGAIILESSKHKSAAFEFISWWTSDDTQTEFGLACENLMGASARWPTANKNAFMNMRWTRAQRDAILTQWEFVDDIPQLPGNYIINRSLSFAFRAVVYDEKIPREVLAKYNKDINKEIKRKWEEFTESEASAQ